MKIYDTVGIAFPKHDPVFAKDDNLLRLVTRIEHLVEIRSDLEECICALRLGTKLMLDKQ
jgi:hypothetical protein